MSWLTDPYASQFMQRALVAALIVGVLAPVVGVWMVLRRLAYLGDAMSHATLGGVALAHVWGASVLLGALVAGVAMGLVIAVAARQRRVATDAVIGITESALFALGVLVISRVDSGVELSHFLFGQITTVSTHDLVVSLGLTAAALVTIVVMFRELRLATFDPLHAGQVGVRVDAVGMILLVLVSVTVVVSLGTVGLLMSIALLVTPAASARLVTDDLVAMTVVAAGLGVTAAFAGLTVSYHADTAPGATIALACVACAVPCLGLHQVRRRRNAVT